MDTFVTRAEATQAAPDASSGYATRSDKGRCAIKGLRLCAVALLCVALAACVSAARVYAAPPAQGTGTVHVVQAGETLYGIAQRYGTTVDVMMALNGLGDPDRILVGQRLLLPGASGVSSAAYEVLPGDTLVTISRRYGVTVSELARLNHLARPDLIYVGQRLLLPGVDGDDSSVKGVPGAPRPMGAGQVYVVQVGDTLVRIAARHDVSVWALAQVNQIVNPSVIHVGQRLLIPVGEDSVHLPPPFKTLEVVPAVAVQGQCVQVAIEADGEVSLSGQYDGRTLVFAQDAGVYRTLIAIPAMALPGPYPLELHAVRAGQETSIRNMLYVTAGSYGMQYINLPADKVHLLDPELVAQESQRLQEVTTQATFPGLWQGRFAAPLAGPPATSAPFGGRRSYNGRPAVSYHAGVDYRAGTGTPVLCPARGKVVLAEALHVRGNAVVVDHGRGVMSGYWHLAQIQVSEGQMVERGDVLGLVGSTGLSTGAHLHWEVRVMGIPVDPLQWVREEIR